MLFHTWTFLIFFSVFLLVYTLTLQTRWRIPWLLLASYVFYGWWNPLFLVLIIYATLVDWFVGIRLAESSRRKAWLVFGLCNNLFLLGFFKYAGFFAENLQSLFVMLHIPVTVPVPNIFLPVGISFFTFQSMSYIIDAYRKIIPTERNLMRYAAYVALFPQMVAGPIERAKAILPQLQKVPVITKTDISDGISLFVTGLFKKVVMADFLAGYVDKIYGNPDAFGSATLVLATYAFAWQIYFDFSGYTDMARGTARIMGIKLMLNFNNPYTAVDIGDFWRRWHISLSSWFKDYVYIPMGGNKTVKYKIWQNIFLTMLISGFWHGAAWTYIIWGALNGLGRLLSLGFERTEFYVNRMPKLLKQLLVFHFICLTWIFFRASTLNDAMIILKRIFSFAGGDVQAPIVLLLLTAAIWGYQLIFNSSFSKVLEHRACRMGAAVLAIILVIVLSSSVQKQFIYFQF